MKMFHQRHSSIEKESKPKKLDMQTLMFLIERFEKANQLEAAYSLIEIAREYFPGNPRFACIAGDIILKLEKQEKQNLGNESSIKISSKL